MSRPARPPRPARRLLARVLPADARESVLGDLEEVFRERAAARGPRRARLWYWKEAVGFSVRFAWERLREGWGLGRSADARTDVRLAVRRLRKDRRFTTVIVVTLALSIGTATAVFSAFRAVVLEELPVAEPERIVSLSSHREDGTPVSLTPEEVEALGRESRTLQRVAGVATFGAEAIPLVEGDRALVLNMTRVTADFFDLLGARPALGRLLRPRDGEEGARPVTVISYGAWQRVFGGDPGVLGRRLTTTQYRTTYTVVGVAPPGLDYPVGADYWILPSGSMNVVARLAPDIGPETARSEFLSIVRALDGERSTPRNPAGATVRPLTEAVVGDARPLLHTIMAGVGLLLLIASVNVGTLLLMRLTRRSHEVVVRRALGATSAGVARLFLVECVFLAGPGARWDSAGRWCCSGPCRSSHPHACPGTS